MASLAYYPQPFALPSPPSLQRSFPVLPAKFAKDRHYEPDINQDGINITKRASTPQRPDYVALCASINDKTSTGSDFPWGNARPMLKRSNESGKLLSDPKRPPLSNLITVGLPQTHAEKNLNSPNLLNKAYHPGYPTPIKSSNSPTISPVEGLQRLAQLLSPLRHRATTNESLGKSSIVDSTGSRTAPSSLARSDTRPPWQAGYDILPSSSSTLYPDGSWSSRSGSNRGDPVTLMHLDGPLRTWGKLNAHDFYDVYNPTNTRFPSLFEFSDILSPVVRANSAAVHTHHTTIWRNLSVKVAQELYNWGQVWDQALEIILFELSRRVRKSGYETRYTHAVWKLYTTSFEIFGDVVWNLYIQRFDQPRWIDSQEKLITLIRTLDTCCSKMNTMDLDMNCWDEPGYNSPGPLVFAMRFGPRHGQARRYMRQLVVDPSHIYATAGDEYQLHVELWDPHQAPDVFYELTTFTLLPQLPWLRWDPASKSFNGKIPSDLGTISSNGSMSPGTTQFNITIVATTRDPLPNDVIRETIVRATVIIWLQAPMRGIPSLGPLQDRYEQASRSSSPQDYMYHATPDVTRLDIHGRFSDKSTVINIAPPQESAKDVYEERDSFDTDLSGSEARFVRAMQANVIPGLGSHTRMLTNNAVLSAAKRNYYRARSLSGNSDNISLMHGSEPGIDESANHHYSSDATADDTQSSLRLHRCSSHIFLPPPSETDTVHRRDSLSKRPTDESRNDNDYFRVKPLWNQIFHKDRGNSSRSTQSQALETQYLPRLPSPSFSEEDGHTKVGGLQRDMQTGTLFRSAFYD
ncbi:hypothetical protein EX30DRAFT_109017 [Ascodesmis nigricans]|uniref:Uncharacterized protein n=1 Tax=Ascodesmis nigricans TaxID=341454 RepID=A0A4S2MQH7_9PEZI|nr:hypothetical protein EX30DRAFT_109017 [Ascodesmis nigricans]